MCVPNKRLDGFSSCFSAILYGYIMYPKYDIYKHFKSIVRYADYTLGLKELRFKETTVFVSGKNHLLFGNDDINYRGKVGEVVLGYFEPGWKNLTYQLQGKVEGHTKSNDLYVHWKAKEFAPSLEQQKIGKEIQFIYNPTSCHTKV